MSTAKKRAGWSPAAKQAQAVVAMAFQIVAASVAGRARQARRARKAAPSPSTGDAILRVATKAAKAGLWKGSAPRRARCS